MYRTVSVSSDLNTLYSPPSIPRPCVHLNTQGFQKEITLNTERIDGLIVFGEGLIQKSSPMDAAVIEEELEELHAYCQEVFSRLVRFHQRLSTTPVSSHAHTRTHTHAPRTHLTGHYREREGYQGGGIHFNLQPHC